MIPRHPPSFLFRQSDSFVLYGYFLLFVNSDYARWTGILLVTRFIQAITDEKFSQSEYVAFGAISQFAFPPLAKAIHRAFDYVNLSNLCSKQAFHSINLSNVGFIIESQSVRIHVSFRQKPINKLRFEAENSTDPYAFVRIDWDRLDLGFTKRQTHLFLMRVWSNSENQVSVTGHMLEIWSSWHCNFCSA